MHLRQLSKDLGKRSGQSHWVEMSERIEALVKGEKKLNPNVDFYSASMYYALGIPIVMKGPRGRWIGRREAELDGGRAGPPGLTAAASP